MQKILFIVTQSEFGGAQRYIYEILRGLNKEKYSFVIAAGEGDKELFKKISKLKNQNSKLRAENQNLKYLKRRPRPWEIFLAIKEILDLLRKEKPNVLFLCSTTAGLLGSIASLLYKLTTHNLQLTTVYRIGGWAFKDPRNKILNLIVLLAEKMTAILKDKIIVNSEEDLKLALKYKIASPEKIIKIYNGIDPGKLKFLPKKEARQKLFSLLSTKPGNVVIGTVANFYKTKGLEYLIEAAHILSYKLKAVNYEVITRSGATGSLSYKLIIIGEGREGPKLEALIKEYNLKNQVFLVGRIPNAYKYLKAFDIFVLPSLKEGFPWVILEAMAAEIPIISTRVGALPEIITDGQEGILIEPKNSEILAEKILWMIIHPEKAKKMAHQAKKRTEQFSLEKMLSKTEELFII